MPGKSEKPDNTTHFGYKTVNTEEKAGKVAEALEDYSDAVGLYEEIKKNYSDTKEGREVEKYLARAKTLASK